MKDELNFESVLHERLDQYMMECLVFDTNELSSILKGHLFVERVLETLISRKLEEPRMFFRNRISFELKVDLARALGVLPQTYSSAFKALNNVRNKYSHELSYKITFDELSSFKLGWDEAQNEAYRVACDQGIDEAAQIATIFLCWKAELLIASCNT